MLSNAYFLAKFRFDTAENEPAKNLQIFAKKMQNRDLLVVLPPVHLRRGVVRRAGLEHDHLRLGLVQEALAADGGEDARQCT